MAKDYKIIIPVTGTPGTLVYDVISGTPTNFNVDRGVSKQTTQRILKVNFGDGYEQRAPDGINIEKSTYSVAFKNREFDEIQVIEDYLNDNASLSFDFYIDEDIVKVVCDSFSIQYPQESVYSLTAQFRRVYEP